MPSPCAALTSAPFFSSVLTASRSRAIAASATGAAAARSHARRRDRQRRNRSTCDALMTTLTNMNTNLRKPPYSPCPRTFRTRRSSPEPLFNSKRPVLSPNVFMFETDVLHHREEHVGHRRAVGGLQVQVAAQRATGLAGEEQRAALVVVHVRVAHRRSVDHQRVVEQVVLAVRRVLQLLQEVRNHADVIAVDLHEVGDALLALAVVRGGVERAADAALGIDARRTVAAHLEREDARRVRRERQHLQVEHQLDVLGEIIRHADRRVRQLAHFAAAVARFDVLDAALDLADLGRDTGRGAARSTAPRSLLQPRHFRADPVEDALVGAAALRRARPAWRRRRTASRTPRAGRESSAAAAWASPS